MEEIKKATLYIAAAQYGNRISSALVAVCLSFCAILRKSPVIMVVFLLFAIISMLSGPIIRRVLVNTLDPDAVFRHSKAYLSLIEQGYTDEFIETIDGEIKNDLIIQYREDAYRAHLFVTKTWFILIGSDRSIIRKVSDISKVYVDFVKRYPIRGVCFEFADGVLFSGVKSYEQIFELFKQNFPELVEEPPEDNPGGF